MTSKNSQNPRICVIARNKRFFEYISRTFQKAEYEYVDVTNTENCCDENEYNCVLKIVATVDPETTKPSSDIPIVILGGSDDINSIVKSVKIGAFDFVERIVGKEKDSITKHKIHKKKSIQFDEYKKLTKTERTVLHQIMKGKSNREIADQFHRSIRTIEDHRNHIMQKLHADNLVELVKKCIG